MLKSCLLLCSNFCAGAQELGVGTRLAPVRLLLRAGSICVEGVGEASGLFGFPFLTWSQYTLNKRGRGDQGHCTSVAKPGVELQLQEWGLNGEREYWF